MKMISWNVNGLRACIQKGFLEQFDKLDADFFCLQETKLQAGQLELKLPGYEQYWNYAEKKGYSGTAVFTKHTPVSVSYGLGVPELDTEGRLITLEYKEFYLVTCYTPNAQRGLARIDHRMRWDEAFRAYIAQLDAQKPTIICGDLNVAHQEIDLKNPGSNRGNAGFSDRERESFAKTLELGFTDTFRHLHPDATGCYSWWSYMFKARENNAGWRIDYFLVSDRLKDAVYKTPIYSDILGSDHCPVGLEIDILCNGSLWSPASEGSAAQTSPVTNPKTQLTPAKTVITTALLCGILGIGLFAGHRLHDRPAPGPGTDPTVSTPPPAPTVSNVLAMATDSDLIRLYTYDEHLEEVEIHQPSSSSLPQVNAFIRAGQDVWRLERADSGFLSDLGNRKQNLYLRLEMTEFALSYYDESQDPVLEAALVPMTELSSFVPPAPILTIRDYYDENQKVAGWFITGYLFSDATVTVTLPLAGSTVQIEIIASPIGQGLPQMTTVELVESVLNNIEITYPLSHAASIAAAEDIYSVLLTDHPILQALEKPSDAASELFECMKQGDRTAAVLLSLPVYQQKMTPALHSLYTEVLAKEILNDSEITQLLSLASSAAEAEQSYYTLLKESFTLQALEACSDAVEPLLTYMDEFDPTAATLLSLPVYQQKMTDTEQSQYAMLAQAIASPNKSEAAAMTTEALVAYIAELDTLPIFYVTFGDLLNDTGYYEAKEYFPVIIELEQRADACSCILNYSGADTYGNLSFFLSHSAYQLKMTDYEKALYITGSYSFSLNGGGAGQTPTREQAAAMSTQTLAYRICDLSEFSNWLAQCNNNPQLREMVYEIAAEKHPMLRELEGREDAIEALEEYHTQNMKRHNYMQWLVADQLLQLTVYPKKPIFGTLA